MCARWLGLGFALLCCLPSAGVRADDALRVLAAGAVKQAITELAVLGPRGIADHLELRFDTVGALRDAVLAGERADIVILSEEGIAALAKASRIDERSKVDVGSTAVALAVRKGAPVPDVSSPEALRNTVLTAASIAYADPVRGATAGAYFAGVLERLGVAGEVAPRITVLPFGGDVIQGVGEGRFALGVSQSSEIMAHREVTLVGPLPAPYDRRTRYQAATGVGAGDGARAFLAFLQGTEARAAFAASGLSAP
jgi:molybdate transport system substrate-binding protein